MRKKRKKRELDDLDRRILAKIEELSARAAVPPPTEADLDERILAKIAELNARIAEKRAAGGEV